MQIARVKFDLTKGIKVSKSLLVIGLVSVVLNVGWFSPVLHHGKLPEEVQVSIEKQKKDLDCLTKNIYFEARNQGTKGMQLVAEVTRNRLLSGKHGDTYCKVVYQPWQFSWVKQAQKPKQNSQELTKYKEASKIAFTVMQPTYKSKLPEQVTYYHTLQVKPHWSVKFKKYATIGNHVFYTPTKG